MKKTIALVVMALMLFSVIPVALADEGPEDSGRESSDSRQDVKAVASDRFEDARAKQRELMEQRLEEAKQKRAEITRRNIAFKDRVKMLREQYKENQDRVKELREQVKERTEELRKQREERLKELKETHSKGAARDYLVNVAKHELAFVERVKEHIEKSALSDEEKTALLAQLEDIVARITAAHDSFGELGEADSREQFKEAIALAKDIRKDVKHVAGRGVGKPVADKMGGILKRMDKLEGKLERTIARLEQRGIDVSAAQEQLDAFDAKLDEAEALHDQISDLFSQGQVSEAAKLIPEAHKKLREAHAILMRLWNELKQKPGAAEALAEAGDEDEADDAGDEAEDAADEAEDAAEDAEDAAEDAAEAAEDAADEAEDAAEDAEDAAEEAEESGDSDSGEGSENSGEGTDGEDDEASDE